MDVRERLPRKACGTEARGDDRDDGQIVWGPRVRRIVAGASRPSQTSCGGRARRNPRVRPEGRLERALGLRRPSGRQGRQEARKIARPARGPGGPSSEAPRDSRPAGTAPRGDARSRAAAERNAHRRWRTSPGHERRGRTGRTDDPTRPRRPASPSLRGARAGGRVAPVTACAVPSTATPPALLECAATTRERGPLPGTGRRPRCGPSDRRGSGDAIS